MSKLSNMLVICCMAAALQTNAQTSEDQSNGAYTKALAKKTIRSLDKNDNGYFDKSENQRVWGKLSHLDKDKDDKLSVVELEKKNINYLETGSRRLLNVQYKATEQEDLYMDIYYPTNTTDYKNLPTIIYTHGGGWAAGNKQGAAQHNFKKTFVKLLEQGFCIVSVNYRLWKPNGKVRMRDCVTDAKDAMRYLAKNNATLGLNPNRFFTFGDSAGGQMAQLLALADDKVLPGDKDLAAYTYNIVCGVSWYGPADFEKTELFNHDDRPNFRDRFGLRITNSRTKSKENLDLYREMSPINYLTEKSAPLLLIQGDMDETIPVKHAYYMLEKAKTVNAPIEISIVENAGHNWRKQIGEPISPTQTEIVQQTVDFFVAHK